MAFIGIFYMGILTLAILILLYRLGMIFIIVAHDLQKKGKKGGTAIVLMILGYLIAIPVGMILISFVVFYLMMRF